MKTKEAVCKRIILSIFFLLVLCRTAGAQDSRKATLSAANAGSCTATSTACLVIDIPSGSGGATFNIGANASANTVQFEASADYGSTWVALNVVPSNATTAVTSTTSTGAWQANVAGYTKVRMRCSTFVGGTTDTYINLSTASASARAGGGGLPNGTTVSGSDITFPGGLSLPTIVSTSGQAGADLGARINSCFAVAKIVAVGGVCDARQDTGTTISTQINFPQSGTPPVTVLLPPAHISQSAKINIANCAGCAIIGSGSADTAATSMTSLTWTGITTDPQIYITGNRNRIEHLNLKGSTVHLPLAGIEIDSTGTNDGLFNMLTDLQIGDFALGIGQYTNGVLIAGPNSAASNNTLNSVYIVGAVNCFSNTNQQATDTMLRDFTALYCTVGLHANTGIVVQNAYFGGNTGADVELDGAGEVNIHNYNSQNSARIAQQSATATNVKLEIIGGNAGFGSLLNADGKVINFCNVGGTLSSYIDIQDFTWNQAGQTQEAVICQFNSSGGSNSYDFLRLVNTTGFPPTAINIGTNQGPNDQRTVIYEPAIDSGTPHQVPRMALHTSYIKAADRAWQSWRNDFAGKFNVFGGEFRVNQLEPPGTTFGVAVATIGVTGATQYCYRVTALTYSGETTALAEQCVANGNAVLSASNREEIFWAQVLGAYAYNVYGRTTGAEQLMFTVTHDQLTQFTPPAYVVSYSAGNVRVKDTGATTPSGALPTKNTTGAGTVEGIQTAASYSTSSNCSSSASPAVCGSAAAGSVAVPTGVTPTLVVNTTAVSANSQILFTPDESLGTKLSVTCNSTIAQVAIEPIVTARTAATSFTIQYNTTITVNPICLSYWIIN